MPRVQQRAGTEYHHNFTGIHLKIDYERCDATDIKQMPFRLPMITGKSLSTPKIAFTKNLGAFVGRSVPIVGWLILAYDVEEITRKTLIKYNSIAIDEDKLW